MFEQSLVESTHVIKTQNRWSVWVSIAIQAAIAAVIVIVPLMHPESIGHLVFNPPQLILPSPPPPPPPPVQMVTHAVSAAEMPTMAAPQAAHLMPAVLHSAVDSLLRAQADGEGPPGPSTNLPNGMGNGTSGTDIFSTAPTGARVAVARPVGPVRLSTGVTAGMLIVPIQATYPIIARNAHQEGTVIVHAIISKSGHIESATVTSGPMLLQQAALDAVKGARYHPYLLNDQPTEVDTTINIVFHISE